MKIRTFFTFIAMISVLMSGCEKQVAIKPEIPDVSLFGVSLDELSASTVTFTGTLNVSSEDYKYCRVILYYTEADKLELDNAELFTEMVDEHDFKFALRGLRPLTTYKYVFCVKIRSEVYFDEVKEFTTLQDPYDVSAELDVAAAEDLSAEGQANCYIVSKPGLYRFKAVKGNGTESAGAVSSACIIWESFGTDVQPLPFDLVKEVCYKDGYVVFRLSNPFRVGNALLAVRDKDKNVLWSWHIWLTAQPEEQVYYNGAGTMMDRNLGATSAVPGEVGTLGLLYQWGRKDPFLNSSSVTKNSVAKSTIVWPYVMPSQCSVEYAVAHPTTMIMRKTMSHTLWDWAVPEDSLGRWRSDKTIYDPCPPGWRVPDGGKDDGFWVVASSEYEKFYPSEVFVPGMNFSGEFGNDSSIWYPFSGYWRRNDDSATKKMELFGVGTHSIYWTVCNRPMKVTPFCIGSHIWNGESAYMPSVSAYFEYCASVRCTKQ